jgi:hypothetical protein
MTDDDVRAWLTTMSTEGALDLDADSRALATQALFMINGSVPAPSPGPTPAPPADEINPATLMYNLIDPTLAWLNRHILIQKTDEARVILHAIAGQETNWAARLQYGGPARSWWQFEKGGGVHGVVTHPASASKIKTVCNALMISCDESTIYEAMAWNGMLACSMARLLLYTDPAALPEVGDVDGAWAVYSRTWRPGAPHPEVWPQRYAVSQSLL